MYQVSLKTDDKNISIEEDEKIDELYTLANALASYIKKEVKDNTSVIKDEVTRSIISKATSTLSKRLGRH